MHGFDVRKGPKKPIDARGQPKTGLGPKAGTPSWIKAAVNAAERKADKGTGSEHRSRGHQAGTGGIRSGLFPKREVTRAGQAGS